MTSKGLRVFQGGRTGAITSSDFVALSQARSLPKGLCAALVALEPAGASQPQVGTAASLSAAQRQSHASAPTRFSCAQRDSASIGLLDGSRARSSGARSPKATNTITALLCFHHFDRKLRGGNTRDGLGRTKHLSMQTLRPINRCFIIHGADAQPHFARSHVQIRLAGARCRLEANGADDAQLQSIPTSAANLQSIPSGRCDRRSKLTPPHRPA